MRIEDELHREKVVIVAGFQGMSYKREITTLGRGGSDTTAVALAAALGADCEIYSDVDGVYSADPRIVAGARHLPQLGYDEMQELAEHGAKVLNAQAVEWARRAGIVIHARATSGSERETKISAQGGGGSGVGRAVTGTRRLTRVSGGSDALRILEEERVSLRQAVRGALRFVRDDVPDWPRIERRLMEDGAELAEEGAVTIVGEGVGCDAALIRRALAAVTHSDYSAAPLRLTLSVEPEGVDEATRALHDMISR